MGTACTKTLKIAPRAQQVAGGKKATADLAGT